jgi:dihydropteroate synthase
MTELRRPRLLRAVAPPPAELQLYGFDALDRSLEHQVILWTELPLQLISQMKDVAVCGVSVNTVDSSAMIRGSRAALSDFASTLADDGFGSAGALMSEVVESPGRRRTLQCGRRQVTFDRPHILGILNVTPDSFFDGGRYSSRQAAVARALEMEAQGADVIEIGGEKAGPGDAVDAAEELRRVLPVIECIRQVSEVLISVDTRKPEVALSAAAAGADIINDINGLRAASMRHAMAETGVGVVIMHIQGAPRLHLPHPHYHSVMGEIGQFLHESVLACEASGIGGERIAIDPGPSFGKAVDHDLQLMRAYGELRGFPQPNVLAVSRKGFIGTVLNGLEPAHRLEGSLAVVAYAITQGVDMIRTHDVAATGRVISILSAVAAGASP